MTDSPPSPPADDFSIGDVAAATGITPETLRVWERRYGRPQALRLPSGHRRYTADHVRWVRRIAEALARGHRPHKVVPLDDAALDALLAPEVAGESLPAGAAEVLDLVRSFRATELRERLAEAWDPDRHLAFLEEWIAPIVRLVGRSWADGEIEIRHEHFASEILQDVLRSARNDYPVPDEAPRVVLTTLSGETHGLGLQMAALSCAAHGVPYRLLGVDTPNEEIVRAASELGVSIVALERLARHRRRRDGPSDRRAATAPPAPTCSSWSAAAAPAACVAARATSSTSRACGVGRGDRRAALRRVAPHAPPVLAKPRGPAPRAPGALPHRGRRSPWRHPSSSPPCDRRPRRSRKKAATACAVAAWGGPLGGRDPDGPGRVVLERVYGRSGVTTASMTWMTPLPARTSADDHVRAVDRDAAVTLLLDEELAALHRGDLGADPSEGPSSGRGRR